MLLVFIVHPIKFNLRIYNNNKFFKFIIEKKKATLSGFFYRKTIN